ncbi:MAG: hypothetical protein ACOYL7_16560 [Caldilinea sp.]
MPPQSAPAMLPSSAPCSINEQGVLTVAAVPNRPSARIFMGDAGSAFLGFTLATLAVLGGLAERKIIVCTGISQAGQATMEKFTGAVKALIGGCVTASPVPGSRWKRRFAHLLWRQSSAVID